VVKPDPVQKARDEKAERWRIEHEAEIADRTKLAEQLRLEKAERWRIEHEAELADKAEQRRQERESKRAQNQTNWRASRELEVVVQREDSNARKAARSADWASRSLPVNDPFVIEMAERFPHTANSPNPIPGYQPGDVGCTPEEFLEWQRQRRKLMAHPQTQEEIDEIMRKAR